jgi:DNA-binding CsgD family transcriptional regulator
MVSERDAIASGFGEGLGELTPREHEVAALISDGLTNEEIAQRLTLTPGTVANHVAHILAKTGARSRVQVAVKLVRTPPARIADDVLTLLRRLQVLGPIDARGALQQATELLGAHLTKATASVRRVVAGRHANMCRHGPMAVFVGRDVTAGSVPVIGFSVLLLGLAQTLAQ